MRGLTTLRLLSDPEVAAVLDRADSLRESLDQADPLHQSLAGSTVATAFFEPSTRTRLSFERAAGLLGADTMSFSVEGSSVAKGEGLVDTAATLAAMGADLLVLRHQRVDAPRLVEELVGIPVVNGGAGRGEHPTQTLTDALTLRRHFGSLEGLRVGIVGDVANSRVARGHLELFPRLGMEVSLIGPSPMLPEANPWGVGISHDLVSELGDLDVVYLLRVQLERGSRHSFPTLAGYARRFGMRADRIPSLKPGSVVMHPGPLNRGVEVDSAVADSEPSLIAEQVRNGVPLRMAVLEWVVGR